MLISSCIDPYTTTDSADDETAQEYTEDVPADQDMDIADDSDSDSTTEPEDETAEETKIIEASDNETDQEIENPAVEIEEETEEPMELKAIENYPSYAFGNGILKGLSGNVAETCGLVDTEGNQHKIEDFYKDGTSLFFSISAMERGDKIKGSDPVQYEAISVTHYYKQASKKITEIPESDFSVPKQTRKTMIDGGYKIQDAAYDGVEGGVVSNVSQGSPNTNFITVDGYYLDELGLWFSVPVGPAGTSAAPGVYFFPVGTSRIQNVGEYGRIW
ncbi:MAG: hypothetical protein PF450_17000 [Bacteroidales bacterium]|jgi:hypothetical protein|nr:hypothetical protein [Bacteroidales bacterium]